MNGGLGVVPHDVHEDEEKELGEGDAPDQFILAMSEAISPCTDGLWELQKRFNR